MTNLLFKISILISFFFLSNNLFGGIIGVTNDTLVGMPCPGVSSCLEFSIEFKEDIGPNKEVIDAFSYLITFGDGSYRNGVFRIPDKDSTAVFTFSHTYATSDPQHANVRIITLYSETIEPDKLILNSDSITGGVVIPQTYDPPPKTGLEFFTAWDPKAGDELTYMVTLNPDCPQDITNAVFHIWFPNDKMEINQLYAFPGGFNFHSRLPAANDTGHFSVSPNVTANTIWFFIMEFKVDSSIVEGDAFTFESLFKENIPTGNCSFDSLYTETILYAVKAHDPNKMVASASRFCLDNTLPNFIEYKIIFQNLGSGEADRVIINHTLPEVFDINSLAMIKPEKIDTSKDNFEIDTLSRTVRWVLQDSIYLKQSKPSLKGFLRGANEPDFTENYTIDDTIDTLIFRVTFDQNNLPNPCEKISSDARIVFNSEDPIQTNLFTIEVECDDLCTLCTDSFQTAINLPAVTIGNNESVVLSLPDSISLDSSKVFWTPSKGLNDPSLKTPIASPEQNTDYTVTVVTGCKRTFYKIPVIIDDNNNFISKLITCLLLISLIIALLFFLRNRNQV